MLATRSTLRVAGKSSTTHACPPCTQHLLSPSKAIVTLKNCCTTSQPVVASTSHRQSRRAPHVATRSAAVAESTEDVVDVSSLARDANDVLTYAMQMAWDSETYELHSWMLLLGILRHEDCTAAQVLKSLGLDDLYGAWHEVLWALNVADGLEPRSFTPKVQWGTKAYKVVNGAVHFAAWAQRPQVQSEDLLLALAAADVPQALFPDLDLSFDAIKRGIESTTGVKYNLPGYGEPALPLVSADSIF